MSIITIRPATAGDEPGLHTLRRFASRSGPNTLEPRFEGTGHQITLVGIREVGGFVATLPIGIARNDHELHRQLGYSGVPESEFPVLTMGRATSMGDQFERTLHHFVIESSSDLAVHAIFRIARAPSDEDYRRLLSQGWQVQVVDTSEALVALRLPKDCAAGAELGGRTDFLAGRMYEHQYVGEPLAHLLGL